MKKFVSLLLILVSFACTNAQTVQSSGIPTAGESSNFKSALGTISLDPYAVYDIDGSKKGFKYADIGGTPFLFDDWKSAVIYDTKLRKIAQVKVRFNTYSGQLHFLDAKDQELVADKEMIKRVEILKIENNGESEIVLEKGFVGNKNTLTPDQFVEVLNAGDVQLLKLTTNKIVQKDSLVGTMKILKFYPTDFYFLKVGNSCEKLKKLEASEVIALLPNKNVITAFESNKKLKLKKEKEIIEFLNYYNQNSH
jgi:hypothetical protein